MCPTSERLLPLEGRILDGKFRFLKRLGEGGMGTVWMCENVLVRRTVAIKLMHVQYSRDEGVLARFRNEATAAGRIGSKYICDILDLGKSSLGPYIVMEMLSGMDLSEFVQQKGALDVGTTVMIVRQALIGLEAAHQAGIVHRDLKPENLFLHQPESGKLLVKLMDFGISKFTEGNEAGKTGLGVLMGTPEYMSPEQTEGAARVDHRTDIWAMGVILYWALSGQAPFMGPTMAATLMNVTMREPPPLVQLAAHVPPELAAIIDRCLRKRPEERWISAQELNDALAPFEVSHGAMFVPYASGSGDNPKTSLGGGRIASPQHFSQGPRAQAASPPSASPPVSASVSPHAGSTWSNEIRGPVGSAPTISVGEGWSDPSERPQRNIEGGGRSAVWAVLAAVVAAAGVAGFFAYKRFTAAPSDEPPALVSKAPAKKAAPTAQDPAADPDPSDGTPGASGASQGELPATGEEAETETEGAQKPSSESGESKQPSEASKPSSGTKPRTKPRGTTKPSGGTPPRSGPKPNLALVDSVRSYWVRKKRSISDSARTAAAMCASDPDYANVKGWTLPSEGQIRSIVPKGSSNDFYWLGNGKTYSAKSGTVTENTPIGGKQRTVLCIAPKK